MAIDLIFIVNWDLRLNKVAVKVEWAKTTNKLGERKKGWELRTQNPELRTQNSELKKIINTDERYARSRKNL